MVDKVEGRVGVYSHNAPLKGLIPHKTFSNFGFSLVQFEIKLIAPEYLVKFHKKEFT